MTSLCIGFAIWFAVAWIVAHRKRVMRNHRAASIRTDRWLRGLISDHDFYAAISMMNTTNHGDGRDD